MSQLLWFFHGSNPYFGSRHVWRLPLSSRNTSGPQAKAGTVNWKAQLTSRVDTESMHERKKKKKKKVKFVSYPVFHILHHFTYCSHSRWLDLNCLVLEEKKTLSLKCRGWLPNTTGQELFGSKQRLFRLFSSQITERTMYYWQHCGREVCMLAYMYTLVGIGITQPTKNGLKDQVAITLQVTNIPVQQHGLC